MLDRVGVLRPSGSTFFGGHWGASIFSRSSLAFFKCHRNFSLHVGKTTISKRTGKVSGTGE